MSDDQIDWRDPASIVRARDHLRQKLSGRYGRVDEHLLEGSIDDALMHYKGSPQDFDASRGVPLYNYLELWARSYLGMRLRKVSRRRKHEKAAGVSDKNFEKIVSEMRGGRCINIGKNKAEQETQKQREEAERRKEAFDAIVARLNPRDRAGVQLLCAGASFEEWVQHLGIEQLPRKDQQHRVNVEKDRLKKKLKRWAQKMPGGGRFQIGGRVRATYFDADRERESWLIQLRMSYTQQADGSGERKHSRASCSPFSVCC